MIKGIDISRWQQTIGYSSIPSEIEFIIIKASGGDDGLYTDSKLSAYRTGFRSAGKKIAFYHFAGCHVPPQQEAQYFLDAVGTLKPGEGLALDYEVSLANPVSWCRDFCAYVKEKTGTTPLLYSNEARIRQFDWKPLVDLGCKLWVAKYGANDGNVPGVPPKTGAWPAASIWQYTSVAKIAGITQNTVDMNLFYGNKEEFSTLFTPNQDDMSQAERDELSDLRSFKGDVIANKINEFRIDGDGTVYQIFAIPSAPFFTDKLGNKWENVRVLPADWPRDPKDWAGQRELLRPELSSARLEADSLNQQKTDLTAQVDTLNSKIAEDSTKCSADIAAARDEGFEAGKASVPPGTGEDSASMGVIKAFVAIIRSLWK